MPLVAADGKVSIDYEFCIPDTLAVQGPRLGASIPRSSSAARAAASAVVMVNYSVWAIPIRKTTARF
jgi:hypothetical protein